MQSKSLLFIFGSSPYGSSVAAEGIDALLAAAVFEQSVSVLFIGDGVFQLLKQQHPTGQKNISKMLKALALYEVNNIYIHADSLTSRQMILDRCVIAGETVNNQDAQKLMASADHILTF